MNRIDLFFDGQQGVGLVTYLTAGDPDHDTSAALLTALAENGADMVEIGMPFSDPMADGPAIQAAALRALENDADMHQTLELAKGLRDHHADIPIILMGYANPIFQYGVAGFCSDAAQAGVDGLIIVDLPPEESDLIVGHARENNIHLIYLVTPTTTEDRLQTILKRASGFLYYVSITGITGTGSAITQDIEKRIEWLRGQTDLPISVGFGIKTPDDAASMAKTGCDAVVVGSALVEAIARADDPLKTCADMTKGLKEALS